MKKTFVTRIEQMAHDGTGVGTHEGRPVRVMGMFPGEEGVVEAYTKKGLWLGTLRELLKASPSRTTPEELHYMTCAPWQAAAYPLQVELKQRVLDELYGYYPDTPTPFVYAATQFFGYRTKIEFSFADRDLLGNTLPLSLAFHERGGGARRVVLPYGCLLASSEMNRVALALLERLRSIGCVARDLKSLIVRQSKASGKLLAVLFVKSKHTIDPIAISDIPGLSGMIAFYSDEQSPASVATKELWRVGESFLDEMICGVRVRYPWNAFFQNNVPMFELALQEMVQAIKHKGKILELYAGVGTIGLVLAQALGATVYGVEHVPEAVHFAETNAQWNGIGHYTAYCASAQEMDPKLFDGVDVLVLDPPRSGLHPRVRGMILERLPQRMMYLSCNPETQARDYAALAHAYCIEHIVGFDFYPQTPHLESLLVLARRV